MNPKLKWRYEGMKETFEHNINHQAFEGYPEYNSPHNLDGQMDLYAYAAFSSAHPAGHLCTGMGYTNR
jgi:hypothetical protein